MTAPLAAPLALALVALALLAPAQAGIIEQASVCRNDDHCAMDMVCENRKCVSPCFNACGTNTICTVFEHKANCSCSPNYVIKEMTGCFPEKEEPKCTSDKHCPENEVCEDWFCVDPCVNRCGKKAECKVINHIADCFCKEGFEGNPVDGCIEKPVPVCLVDSDCPVDKHCVDQDCKDPCVDKCGNNAICQVTNHMPFCECAPGFFGNPVVGCVRVECSDDSECPLNSACSHDRCVDPCKNKCGPNTTCEVINHYPICRCIPGFSGEPNTDGCSPCYQIPTTTEKVEVPKYKKRFYIHKKKNCWKLAVDECMTNRSALATVLNREENLQVLDLIKKSNIKNDQDFWIGGTDQAVEGQWIWQSTGKPINSFTYWGKGEPNNDNNEDCLAYSINKKDKNTAAMGYMWNDMVCNRWAHTICEYYERIY